MASTYRIVKRRNPTTAVYEDNYGYTINFYQPMIDYLDAKQKGGDPQYPHLPWSNERGLRSYLPSNTVKVYSTDEVKRHTSEVTEHAKQRDRSCEDYRIIHRTPLAVTKSAIGARLSTRLGRSKYDTVEERTIRKLEEQANERHLRKITGDIDNIKERFNAHKDMELSAGLKNAIRGKTASQISAALLAESEKNIKVSRNQEDLMISEAMHQSSFSSGKARITKRTVEIIDDRLIDNLDQSVGSSLCDVRRQLHQFNQRSSDLYIDSRCRKPNYYHNY